MIHELAFLAIADTLTSSAALFEKNDLFPLRGIDLYLEQYLRTEQYETFQTPYLFLELSSTIEPSRRSLSGELTITTHLVLDPKILTYDLPQHRTQNHLKLYRYRALLSHLLTRCHAKQFAAPKLTAQAPIEVVEVFYIAKDTYSSPYNHFNEYDTQTELSPQNIAPVRAGLAPAPNTAPNK